MKKILIFITNGLEKDTLKTAKSLFYWSHFGLVNPIVSHTDFICFKLNERFVYIFEEKSDYRLYNINHLKYNVEKQVFDNNRVKVLYYQIVEDESEYNQMSNFFDLDD